MPEGTAKHVTSGRAETGPLVCKQGMDKAFEALEVATQMVEDARPLLNQAIELVDEVRRLESCFILGCLTPCVLSAAHVQMSCSMMIEPVTRYIKQLCCGCRSRRCWLTCGPATWWATWRP